MTTEGILYARTAIPAGILIIMFIAAAPFWGEWIGDRVEDFIWTYPKVCKAIWWGIATICITILLCTLCGCQSAPEPRHRRLTDQEFWDSQNPIWTPTIFGGHY